MKKREKMTNHQKKKKKIKYIFKKQMAARVGLAKQELLWF
jgi:hypothetical protein